MSYAMMQAIKARGLTASERNVYCYLVGRANGAHVCWPSVMTIAADLEMTPRTVMSATGALSHAGRIKVVKRYKDTNHYFVLGMDGVYDQAKPTDKVLDLPIVDTTVLPPAPNFSAVEEMPEPVAIESGNIILSHLSVDPEPDIVVIAHEEVCPEENDTQETFSGEKNDSYEDEDPEYDNLDHLWPAAANVRVSRLGEKYDSRDPGLGCNSRASGVKKTAPESYVQERVQEEVVQASKQALLRSVSRELAGPSLTSLMAMTGRPAEYCAGVLLDLLKGGTRGKEQVIRAVFRAEAKRPHNPVGFLKTIIDDPPDQPARPVFNALGNRISYISGAL